MVQNENKEKNEILELNLGINKLWYPFWPMQAHFTTQKV